MKLYKSQVCLSVCLVIAGHALLAQTQFNTIPSRIVGQAILQQQPPFTAIAPNLVEGREFNSPQAVAVDTSASPPILYVADTGNNRILVWKNALGFTKGDFADRVIGQRDMYSVGANALSAGFNAPTSMAVDKNGNLYVADTGNNRILRFPAPLQQTTDLLAVDLIIGQKDITGHSANEGQSTPNERTLSFVSGNSLLFIGMTFDAQGNLWVSDSGNNRILRFPASNLSANTTEPAADFVLGQPDFNSNTVKTPIDRTNKGVLVQPAGLAFDPQGRLFVTDAANRVLVYLPPFTAGTMPAARIMGVIPPTQAQPNPPAISLGTLGNGNIPPNGVVFVGNNPYVIDTGNSRILKFDPYDAWLPESSSFSPVAVGVFGQGSGVFGQPNQGQPQSSGNSLFLPTSAVFLGTDLIIADSLNNRVIAVPQVNGVFISASRVLGQVDFKYNAPNLIEGREMNLTGCQSGGGGSAIVDMNASPPHLYVADACNNRVLGFADVRKLAPGVTADLVLGQPDFFTNEVNYPSGDAQKPTDSSLFRPQGLALDSGGNLYVADGGNGRVLRFPAPFNQPSSQLPKANLVVGQGGFFSKVTDASSQTMRFPVGIAFTADGSMAVSDASLNRVLFFKKPAGGDFTTGQAAANVIGQRDFSSSAVRLFNNPRLIAIDTSDRLYVADSGNNRLAIFRNIGSAGNDPSPALSVNTSGSAGGLNNPTGVTVDPFTGEVWVADTNNQRVLRYPQFDNLAVNVQINAQPLGSPIPISVALDGFGNPITAEAVNRAAFYYPQIDYAHSGNSGNYFQHFAPGMIATLKSQPGKSFGSDTAIDSDIPVDTTLGDVQVIANGSPAPLFYVSPSQINFMVPTSVPIGSQFVEFQVVKASTSQVLASGFFRIDPYAPGLFTSDATGVGQLAAINVADNTINGPTHPAKVGTYVSLYGTGQGLIPNAPPDGTPAPGPISTPSTPRVFMGDGEEAQVSYSGLAPTLVGVWQINFKVPPNVPPGPTQVVVTLNDINSSQDPNTGVRIVTTIRVSQ